MPPVTAPAATRELRVRSEFEPAGDQPNALRTSEGRADLAGQLQEFVDAIHEQRQATVTLKDATRAIAVTKQIIESANSNHVIEQKGDS